MINATEYPVVHIVDDDTEVRDSLAELLDSIGLVAHAYASAEEFLAEYDPSTPGCVLVDVFMPGMSGLALQEQITERHLGIPCVVITGHANVSMAVEAMTKGACGFLEKPFRSHELLEVIKRAVQRDHTERSYQLRRRDVLERFSHLSSREIEVVELVAEGAANKQIARRLGISERTVEVHRAKGMKKLGADTLVELIGLALEYRAVKETLPGAGTNAPSLSHSPGESA